MAFIPTKTPSEVKDYTIDWSKDLGSDTIAASAWATSDPVLSTSEASNISTMTTVYLSGGIAGTTYVVTNTVTTTGGRTLQESFKVTVNQYSFL